jgi:hypothetical protein
LRLLTKPQFYFLYFVLDGWLTCYLLVLLGILTAVFTDLFLCWRSLWTGIYLQSIENHDDKFLLTAFISKVFNRYKTRIR